MDDNSKVKLMVGFVLVVVALIILAIINPFVQVSAGQKGVVLNWGAVSGKVLDEGIHWVTPIAQNVVKIDVRIQKEEVSASAASKDLQTVTSKVALNYHLDGDKVGELWKKLGAEYKAKVIDPAIQEAVKSATAKYTAEELITKRESVKDDIKTSLRERLAQDYVVVDELNIINFDFSSSFNAAIEAKVTAEQDALAAKNKLEQTKYEAEQRIASAKGEAEAIRIQAQAIQSQGGKDYVNLQWIEAWKAGGSKVPEIITGSGGSNFIYNLQGQ